MDNLIYEEKLRSNRTEALFIVLTILFMGLTYWRVMRDDFGFFTIAFIFFSIFFLFYTINYRTLMIHMTSVSLVLSFGIFKWTIPFSNIKAYYLDDMYTRLIGGAGIHFMFVRGKYRSYFNFLEYPRVVIVFKKKNGPVAEIAFSTEHSKEVLHQLQERTDKN
jgi:hypothetical protein